MTGKKLTYKDAGVNIDAGNESIKRIKKHVKSTFTKDVLLDVGKFGGMISLEKAKKMKKPALVCSIDGVGTKMKIASMADKWDSVGKDIVNHSSNDILVQGAFPVAFMDYIASDKIEPEQVEQIVKGISEACKEAGISLIAGETAEMPGVYEKGETDLAGAIYGLMDAEDVIDGSGIKKGDVLLGLASDGLHTNGYSLARKVFFEVAGLKVTDYVEEFDCSVGDELLKPHKSYVNIVKALLEAGVKISGMAHITGGGLVENVPRILPKGTCAVINKNAIDVLPVFKFIQEKGNVDEQDMWRTFNMGIGLVVVIPLSERAKAVKILEKHKQKFREVGSIAKGCGVQIR